MRTAQLRQKNADLERLERLERLEWLKERHGSLSTTKVIGTKLFKGLSSGQVATLVDMARPVSRSFVKGELIWQEGDTAGGIGLLLEGTMLCQFHQVDGKQQLVRFMGPGDLINLEAGVSEKKTSPACFEATGNGAFLWFSNSSFLENPSIPLETLSVIQANVLASLAEDTIRLMKRVDLLSNQKVRGRLLKLFDSLREEQGNTLQFDLSQEKLAQHLCVDRSSLSLELNRMRRDGLIDFDRKEITLKYPASNCL